MPQLDEFGKSLNDRIEFVRTQFDAAFRPNYGDSIGYMYVTDVFEDHVVVRGDSKYWKVKFKEKDGALIFASREKWEAVQLSYIKEMLTGSFRDYLIISEFKGKYPEVEIFDDIDVKELTAGEVKPQYVTLPIGMANVTSGNRRYYSDAFLREMEKQVKEVKPIGLMGHLSTDERSHAFPNEAVHWIGTARVGELLWGKGYVPSGEPKDRLNRYKATNKKIATSIDAQADGIWDSNLNAHVMIPETLKLAQIDIAPADRAGIGDLSAVPLLTSEMIDSNARTHEIITVRKVEEDMGKEEAIKELKASDISLLPAEVVAAIRAEALVNIREELGLPEGSDVPASIQEIRTQRETAHREQIKTRVTELASDSEKGIKVTSVQELVVDRVLARNPKTVQEAETLYAEISTSESIQETLSKIVKETMGPNQGTSQVNGKPKTTGKYFIVPEKKK